MRSSASDPDSPPGTCFACGAAVDLVPGLRARLACPACKGGARLVVGGALLETVLESSRPHPLEGSGLNTILNPVEIDGRRGWADFAGGGYAVFEEVLPSADWFDFAVQHSELWHDVLRHLSSSPRSAPSRVAEIAGLVASAAPLRPFLPNIELLLIWWLDAQAGLQALADQGPILTNDDAWRIAEARPRPSEGNPSAACAALLQRLAALAEHRPEGVHGDGA